MPGGTQAKAVEWNPRHLYRKIFADPARMEWFLADVCSPDWNLAQDAGRPWHAAEAEAIARHPAEAEAIRAFRARWHEMIPHAIPESVRLLEDLAGAGVPLYAITNFAADTFAETRARFGFFAHFQGIVVSGELGIVKPDGRIFEHLANRHGVDLAASVFIDDNTGNCAGARAAGMQAIHFTAPGEARATLRAAGLGV